MMVSMLEQGRMDYCSLRENITAQGADCTHPVFVFSCCYGILLYDFLQLFRGIGGVLALSDGCVILPREIQN